MPKRVAVSGNSPTWRRGMAAVLAEAGYAAVEQDSLGDWKPGRDGAAVILHMGSGGADSDLAAFVGEHPHVPVIGVVADDTVAGYAAAVRAGACSVVAEDEATGAFVTVLEAALAGRAAVPFAVLQSMAARIPAAPDPDAWVTPAETAWLRQLADGKTVAELAEAHGYSEREMFRNLNDMYIRIGVAHRTGAIVWATRHGVLDAEPPGGDPPG